MKKFLQDNSGKAVIWAAIVAIVAVLIVFVGFILIYTNSPAIQWLKNAVETVWGWITGLFTSKPAETPNNVIV